MMRAAALLFATVAMALAAALVLTPRGASAQRPAPSIHVVSTFDLPAALIGDRVTFTVRATHPDDVILKATAPKIPNVDVATVITPITVAGASGTQVTTFAFTLQPFVLGTLDTGTVRLSWLRADGSTGGVDAPGAALVLTPVRAATDDALRPLKPQASVRGAPPAWIRPSIAVGTLLALALVAAVVALVARRRTGSAAVEAIPGDASPERVARDALDALRGHAGPAGFDYPSYYGTLAVTVRAYLAARFGFNAHALTTRQLERRMVSHGVDRWQARVVAGLLERCDAAVYARRYPAPASADHDLTVAYEIVELSRPPAAVDGQVEGQTAPA